MRFGWEIADCSRADLIELAQLSWGPFDDSRDFRRRCSAESPVTFLVIVNVYECVPLTWVFCPKNRMFVVWTTGTESPRSLDTECEDEVFPASDSFFSSSSLEHRSMTSGC